MTTLRTKRAVSALAALTLAVGGIGAVEIFSDAAAPAAHAATCPAPTTDISSKMTIGQPELTKVEPRRRALLSGRLLVSRSTGRPARR